jgi:mono/diheme cytochrome c family protein
VEAVIMKQPFKKRVQAIAIWTVTALLTALAVATTVTVGWRPLLGAKSRTLTDRRFVRTPERYARGKYLVEGVVLCFDCHSQATKDFKDLKPGEAPSLTKMGSGRVLFEQGNARLVAPNITPDMETGAGTWTDDQFARAIREGIGHDGRTLFPLMPYQDFRSLSDEDLASVIVYIRMLEPVKHALPKSAIPFPLSRLINSAPVPIHGPVVESASDPIARGRYLSEVAHCVNCHTPKDKYGKPITGMKFAGGDEIIPGIVTANLTPDPSGISYYDEKLFLKVMRTGHVGARPLNQPMPWWFFRNMTDDDLKAIFAYLRTVKPVHHRVDNSETASKCKLCNHSHGSGTENGGL